MVFILFCVAEDCFDFRKKYNSDEKQLNISARVREIKIYMKRQKTIFQI